MSTKLYYIMNFLARKKQFFLANIINKILRIMYACDIHYLTDIDSGLILPHNGLGVVISHNAKIGKNCRIMQNVTIGGNGGPRVPIIGDNVMIGAGAVLLGDIHIGNNVKIGANAVVLKSIPNNSTAVGIPAEVK